MKVTVEGKEFDITPIVDAVEYGLDFCRFVDGQNAAKNMAEVRESPLTAQFEQANALLTEMSAGSRKLFGGTDGD